MKISNYEMEVLVNGKPVLEYLHEGKTFIEGKQGTEFSVKFRNRTSSRALFVPTVDGLSVMNGKEASFESSGYIVDAWDSVTIDGWRTSENEVAKFFFARLEDSYASKLKRDGNQGIIGCAVFREKERPQTIIVKEFVPYPVYPTCPQIPNWFGAGPYHGSGGGGGTAGNMMALSASSNNIAATAMNCSAPSLGTGFGDEKYSPVKSVTFERDGCPVGTMAIYYNTRKSLEDMGVVFKKALYIAPSAFPKERGYCERPE